MTRFVAPGTGKSPLLAAAIGYPRREAQLELRCASFWRTIGGLAATLRRSELRGDRAAERSERLVIARYVLILRHPDGRLEPYVHDADAEVFGVSSRVTIEGRCWHVLRPHVAWRGRRARVAPNAYECEPCPE